MTREEIQHLIDLIVDEMATAAGRRQLRCRCHAVVDDCCPGRLRGVLEAGATRVGVHAAGGAPSEVASIIDHTLLKPDATRQQIETLCREAAEFAFATVCVNPTWVAPCARLLAGTAVRVCSVVGFPLGATLPDVKAYEARRSIMDGAREVDMVINVGALKSGDDCLVEHDIRSVVQVAHEYDVTCKVIIETALLTDDEKVRACQAAKKAGVPATVIGETGGDRIQVFVDGMEALDVLVLPVVFEEKVRGVIELGSLEHFNPSHQAFLDLLTESIGIVINTIEANTRTEDLLRQSQSLAEELQQTNQELQEKARLLAHQNQEVERKNREVEQARQALEEKAAQLALTSKYKSEFLANMSHELRTPLNSLLILSQMLSENRSGNLTDKQVEFAQTIFTSGTDLLSLIDDILDLSKVEAGKMEVHPGPVVVEGVLDYVARTFRPVADEKGLEFNVELGPSAPASIVTDELRLQQVLKNLLSNAFKFTQEGKVSFRIEPVVSGWSAEHVGDRDKPHYWDDFWALQGYRDAAAMAAILGEDAEARRIAAIRDEFRVAVRSSVERTMAERHIDYVPGSVEWADFDPTATANAVMLLDGIANLPQDALERTFDEYLACYRRRSRGEIDWSNYSAYEIRIIGALVHLGRRDDAVELLRFFLADGRHGDMDWMATTVDRRASLRALRSTNRTCPASGPNSP